MEKRKFELAPDLSEKEEIIAQSINLDQLVLEGFAKAVHPNQLMIECSDGVDRTLNLPETT